MIGTGFERTTETIGRKIHIFIDISNITLGARDVNLVSGPTPRLNVPALVEIVGNHREIARKVLLLPVFS